MNVASLELCKELYELSWWDDKSSPKRFVTHQPSADYDLGNNTAGLYTLGYLLRKLPDIRLRMVGTRWCAQNGEYGNDYLADTPEDAAAKLAIELFKQGVLSKEVL